MLRRVFLALPLALACLAGGCNSPTLPLPPPALPSVQAATDPGKVPGKVAAGRFRKLMTLQRKIAKKKNEALVGRELDVLVEGASEEHEFVMEGRHAGQAPDIDGKVYLSGGEAHAGEMRRVRITQASDYDLVGDLLADTAPKKKNKRVGLKLLST